MIVIIDNYDSFTYNLYQAVAVYAQDVIVLRNDAVDASMLQKLKPTALVFSPGGRSSPCCRKYGIYHSAVLQGYSHAGNLSGASGHS
ncbi:hypothetical protein MKA49_05005 [[Clostridium] innocuum]|nr:hypothetical protein [[Clostridium] innocuum]